MGPEERANLPEASTAALSSTTQAGPLTPWRFHSNLCRNATGPLEREGPAGLGRAGWRCWGQRGL